MATVVLALNVFPFSTRADPTSTAWAQRIPARHRAGIALTAIGSAFAVVGIAGLGIVASSTTACGRDSLGLCRANYLIVGGSISTAGFAIAVPLLTTALCLLHVASSDGSLVGQPPTASELIARASRRQRLGRVLAIVGAAMTTVAIGFGAVATADVNRHWENRVLLDASATLGIALGAAGLGLMAGGTTFAIIGQHDARLVRP